MGKATRGLEIRRIRIDALGPLISIPVGKKHLFRDEHDALVVLEAKRHKVRAALAVSSGGELVVPEWLQNLLPRLAKEQGTAEIVVYLSARPVWLVEGEQDDAIRAICDRSAARPLWDRLGVNERKAIALRWLAEEIGLRTT